ncbi:FANTASTIC FOUR 3-like protein [Tanacetum coccineum]
MTSIVTVDPQAAEVDESKNGVKSDVKEVSFDEKVKVGYSFPPELTVLNINGRPRFDLVTKRENGRLMMFMVPNRSPQLVRSPVRNGRLKMWLLSDDQCVGPRERVLAPLVRRSV